MGKKGEDVQNGSFSIIRLSNYKEFVQNTFLVQLFTNKNLLKFFIFRLDKAKIQCHQKFGLLKIYDSMNPVILIDHSIIKILVQKIS